VAQAERGRDLLACESFTELFCSPLRRTRQTAEVVWAPRPFSPVLVPALREISLHPMQGLMKDEAARRVPGWAAWRAQPAAFSIDGHAPVRELWHRAGLAWAALLSGPTQPGRRLLVVRLCTP
jgi:probable phosphoglycerate mutase